MKAVAFALMAAALAGGGYLLQTHEEPEAEAGAAHAAPAGPTLATWRGHPLQGAGWIGARPADPREPGEHARLLLFVDPGDARTERLVRRALRAADALPDVRIVWLATSDDEPALRAWLDERGATGPALLGTSPGTLRLFGLTAAPALRLFDASGREVARDPIGLAAQAR